MTVGTITTGEPGTKVIVENVGTSSDVILNFTIPKGDKGEKGEQGIQGENGDKGESYTNDGTVDLNVKSITSDNGQIKSNGNGKLAVQHFSSENGGVYSSTTDYDLGDIYYGKAPYLSFYAWKTLDNRIFYQDSTQELQYETFLSTGGLQDLTGYYSMNLLFDAILCQKWDADKGEFADIEPTRKRMTIIGTEGFLGHDTVKYGGSFVGDPENPWYYGSRTLRMNPQKLNNIKLNRKLGVSGITNNYMAGTIGLATDYFTGDDDGFITPVIWDTDTDDSAQARALGVPYIPADKKDTLPDTTTIAIGTQSFNINTKKPCWWDGNQWIETCVNNGTADLNVKSIHSDGDKIQSDGNGNLTVGQLSSRDGYNFNYVNKETGDNCSFQTLSTSFSYSYKETGGEYSNFLINKTTTTLTQGNGNGTLSSIVISDDNVSITSIKDANKPSERKNSSFSLTPTSFTLNCNRKSVCDYSDTSNQLNMRVATWFTDKAIFNHVIELADVSSITDTDSLKAGSQAWNDSHKKPCWWDGKQWVDATGNALS
ncbi:unnamed protein product [Commensalibacter communis]|nr:unnamed protein product [Commensalibacter communis]